MLPGFRFLFGAIVLSMSIMVFGLGAAALLRAAHEEFASNPSWHATPEATFAQQGDATRPVLAMLRVEPPPAAPKGPDEGAAAVVDAAPVDPTETTSAPAESERTAALAPEDSTPAETAKPEIAAVEISPQSEPVPADAPAVVEEPKIATAEPVAPPANEAAPTTSEPASAPVSPATAIASTKIATLGGPPVTIEAAPTTQAASIRKRMRAHRASLRRRLALRARLAAQTQPADPFAPTLLVATDHHR